MLKCLQMHACRLVAEMAAEGIVLFSIHQHSPRFALYRTRVKMLLPIYTSSARIVEQSGKDFTFEGWTTEAG